MSSRVAFADRQRPPGWIDPEILGRRAPFAGGLGLIDATSKDGEGGGACAAIAAHIDAAITRTPTAVLMARSLRLEHPRPQRHVAAAVLAGWRRGTNSIVTGVYFA